MTQNLRWSRSFLKNVNLHHDVQHLVFDTQRDIKLYCLKLISESDRYFEIILFELSYH